MQFSYKWFIGIFLFIISLIFFDVITHLFASNKVIVHFFQITVEKNLPTLFSTLQLMLAGFLLQFIYKQHHLSEKKQSYYWKYLSYIFYFLAFDEWFTVHDIIGSEISKYLGFFGDIFGWTAFYLVLMILFVIWSIKFLLQLPKKTAFYFILSGSTFLLGAIGFELLNTDGFQQFFNLSFSNSAAYSIGVIEESLEMFGIFIFNLTLFQFIKTAYLFSYINLNATLFTSSSIFFILDIIITYIVIYS